MLALLGIYNETAGSVHSLHSPRFMMDESQLPLGAALHAQFALEFMRRHSAKEGARLLRGGREEL